MLDTIERPVQGDLVTSAIEAAIVRVLQLEKGDGCEHMIGLTSAGLPVLEIQGTVDRIEPSEEENLRIYECTYLIHNHPQNASLSYQDMEVTAHLPLAKHVYAVCNSGDVYWSAGAVQSVIGELLYSNVGSIVAKAFKLMFDMKLISDDDANTCTIHMVNLIAAKMGLIDYHWKLSKKTAAMYKTYAQRIFDAENFPLNTFADAQHFAVSSEESV